MPLDFKEGFKNVRDFPAENVGKFSKETLERMYAFAEEFGEVLSEVMKKYPGKSPEFFFEGVFNFANSYLCLSSVERERALFILTSIWWSKTADNLILWLKKREKKEKEKFFQQSS